MFDADFWNGVAYGCGLEALFVPENSLEQRQLDAMRELALVAADREPKHISLAQVSDIAAVVTDLVGVTWSRRRTIKYRMRHVREYADGFDAEADERLHEIVLPILHRWIMKGKGRLFKEAIAIEGEVNRALSKAGFPPKSIAAIYRKLLALGLASKQREH